MAVAMATPSFTTLSPQSASTTALSQLRYNVVRRRVTLLGRMERENPSQCAFFAKMCLGTIEQCTKHILKMCKDLALDCDSSVLLGDFLFTSRGREIPGVTLRILSLARAAASDSKGDHEHVNFEKEVLEQQKLAQREVGETVARAEAKVRVAAAAASAAGFAVEVAKQQGAPEDKTEAVSKAADAVARVALKAAKVVKKVQENVAKSSTAAVTEQEEIVEREIERERRKLAKEAPDRDP